MQRFINNPDEVVEDTVKGFIKAHSDIVRLAENPRVVVAGDGPSPQKPPELPPTNVPPPPSATGSVKWM